MICVFPCLSCGDHMTYSLEKRAMVCNTCGNECDIETYDMANMTWEGQSELANDIQTMGCPVCGAKAVLKEGSAKLECSYCGSEMAAFGNDDRKLSPGKIIPCKLSKNDARTKLLGWWLNHKTMPKFDEKKLEMKLQDIYVPVWLYNADVMMRIKVETSDYIGGEAIYSNTRQTIERMYKSRYRQVPFDSSSHIEDELFYNIEPFTYSEMLDFNAAYLSGHMAECYHMEPEYVLPRAVGRLKQFAAKQALEYLDSTIGADEVERVLSQEIDVTPKEVIYALVPIWVCSYTYKGKRRNVFVNGQTGKVSGEVLFTQHKFRDDMILYGISAFFMNLSIAALGAIQFLVYGLSEAMSAISGEMFAMLISLIQMIAANQKIKMKQINEEVQLRQGKKVSALAYAIIFFAIGLGVGIIDLFMIPNLLMQSTPNDAFTKVFFFVFVAALVTGIMVFSFAQQLFNYETFIKKSEYYDYAPRANLEEIFMDAPETTQDNNWYS